MSHYPYQLTTQAQYEAACEAAKDGPEAFWSSIARQFSWRKPFTQVLEWNFQEPKVRWFGDGELNITENCLDRHVATQPDAVALIWEPNDPAGEPIRFTYAELHKKVVETATLLASLSIRQGDRVCIYMGMVPELPVAMLACARLGAIHSVVFGGFSAQSIADRVTDAGARYVITCDGAFRGAKEIPLKPAVDEALTLCEGVEKVLVLRRTGTDVSMQAGRDLWWHDALANLEEKNDPLVAVNAEHPLFILYTSGSTGKPKGVVHSTGGYMVYTCYTFVNVFQYRPGQVFFCTADAGWVTGHSYLVYGPLLAGATVLMFEGVPTWPDAGRFWDIVARHQVNILYTAPTAIRSLMAAGNEWVEGKNLDSLQVLGTVGEPINEEAWHWYHQHIGRNQCPIVDTWWQTETGGILISNLAGVTEAVPGWATLPLPGVELQLMDAENRPVADPDEDGYWRGNLCIVHPWPSILRTTWGDHERCRQQYFSAYPNCYFTGDGALCDASGRYRITGRVDDVLNVSGHRIGTAEVENAINQADMVVESAVVGFPHPVKGEAIYAFVICTPGADFNAVQHQVSREVSQLIGPFARPDRVQVVDGLPKTRSGKIMRRILRKIASGDTGNLGDTTTLLDPGVVDRIIEGRNR